MPIPDDCVNFWTWARFEIGSRYTTTASQIGASVTSNSTDSTLDSDLAYDTKAATSSLSAGVASVILAILFFTPWFGEFMIYGAIVAGILAVVFGIIAVKKRQPKGFALTGLILGALTAIFGIGLIIFALIFIGAIPV